MRPHDRLRPILSWPIVAWICFVFLGSLPYKFTRHADTRHIFDTIGDWLGTFLGDGIGSLFANVGSYVVGSVELLTALVLLAPIPLWLMAKTTSGAEGFDRRRRRLHVLGGLMASAVMAGAVFFHLFSPLGVVVLHEGESDGGSLFKAAVSILVLGIVLATINLDRREH